MRPKVFLSHSKKNKDFIVKIANDLRSVGIDVWYDEWEIPAGFSIRKKIFEDGIPNCDQFFVYLTNDSIESYWVQKELDSAFFRESEEKAEIMILFVDSKDTRDKLSFDLKSLSIPEFNDDEYHISFAKLVSNTWKAYSKKTTAIKLKDLENEKLEIEKEKFEIEKKLFHIEKRGLVDLSKLDDLLKSSLLNIETDIQITFQEAFQIVKHLLAIGNGYGQLESTIRKKFRKADENGWIPNEKNINISKFLGEIIIYGLVELVPHSEGYDEYYHLTELGKEYARRL